MRVSFRLRILAFTVLGSFLVSGCAMLDSNYATLSIPVHTYEVQTNQSRLVPVPVSARPSVALATVIPDAEPVKTGLALSLALDGLAPQTDASGSRPSARVFVTDPIAGLAGLRESRTLQDVPREVRQLSAQWSLSATAAQTGFGFDVDVTPRLSFSQDGDLAIRRIGGEVRLRRDFDQRGTKTILRSWSLFAGADGEALEWEPGSSGRMSMEGVALRDRATVGDLHAGIAVQSGLGQLALSYIRREVEYRDRALRASETEDFAGVTFTIRR